MARLVGILLMMQSMTGGFQFVARATRHKLGWKRRPRGPSGSLSDGSTEKKTKLASVDLDTSRLGLDPALNRFHAPLVYHENYSFSGWPEDHTFPMDKFARIAHSLTHTYKGTHPDSPLPRPLVRDSCHFFRPLDHQQVLRDKDWLTKGPIDPSFVKRFVQGQLSKDESRHIGFREQTSRPELIERTILEVAGTVLTCQLALHFGIAANVAGGTHHAHPTGGAGYTILNDLAVASHVLLTTESHRIQRVLVVDCDVHQGDGTAKFGATEMLKDKLFTLSLHCASNYPRLKAHSTVDVGLPDGIGDDEYLQALEDSLTQSLDQVEPDFVIYDAGVDVYQHDRLGRLNVSEAGIRKRDRYVLDLCVAKSIPVAGVVGGGYDRDVDALARRHAIVHEECAHVWRKYKLWEQA